MTFDEKFGKEPSKFIQEQLNGYKGKLKQFNVMTARKSDWFNLTQKIQMLEELLELVKKDIK